MWVPYTLSDKPIAEACGASEAPHHPANSEASVKGLLSPGISERGSGGRNGSWADSSLESLLPEGCCRCDDPQPLFLSWSMPVALFSCPISGVTPPCAGPRAGSLALVLMPLPPPTPHLPQWPHLQPQARHLPRPAPLLPIQ